MRRCPYCGHRCHGRTCRFCADLALHEAETFGVPVADSAPLMRDELREAVQTSKEREG